MENLPQRWLSLSGISTVLNLTHTQVKTLYKQKLLVRIGKNPVDHRYLDPTPEYAERLRLAAVLLTKQNDKIPINLPLTFILTAREVAEIMGWHHKYSKNYLRENNIPYFQGAGKVKLYTVSAVRDFIWRRNGRKLSKQKSPFLIDEMIAFAKRSVDADTALMPTDQQFAQDEALQKKIIWMMKQTNREVLLADFMQKMELAKHVVTALKTEEPAG